MKLRLFLVAVASLATLTMTIAVAGAGAARTAYGHLPPAVQCERGECEVTTLVAVSGTPPPSPAATEYPVTVFGQLKAPGDHGVCQPNRKVLVTVAFTIGEGTAGQLRTTVRADVSGHFSKTFHFVEPPLSARLRKEYPEGFGRGYAVSGFPEGEKRKYHGKRVSCAEGYYHAGTKWTHTNWGYRYEPLGPRATP